MHSQIILNRNIKPEEFYDKRFKPSLQTKWNFVKLLSLVYPKFSDFIEIKSLEWNRDQFDVMLIDKLSGEILHLTLKDNWWIKKCGWLLCTNDICTWVHYEVDNEHFLKFLCYFLVKGNDINFEKLLRILCSDLKAKKEYYQIFWKANRPPFSIIQDWWHPLHKFRFMVHEGTFRNIDQSIQFNLPEASIHHSERECQWISPDNKDKWYHFFNFPWGFYDHNFDKYYYLTQKEKQEYIEWENLWYGLGLSTDLDENDIVMWQGTDKLSKVIDYAVNNAKERNIKMLSFNCCCVPRIVWDDIYSVLQKAKEKIDIPFIFQWQLEKTPYEQKIVLLEEYLNTIDTENIHINKKSISLFWFHENIYQKELGDLLKEKWIKINTSFIPTIDVRLLPLMYTSELFVFSPNNFQKEAFEYPFQEINKNYIEPEYPYGVEKSQSWLTQICHQLGIEYHHSDDTKIILEKYKNKVSFVKEKKYSIGVSLIWKQEVKKFLSTDYMSNIDIVEFLDEMWFTIKFFIYDDFSGFISNNDDSYKKSDGNHEEILDLIYTKISKNSDHSIDFYSNEEQFETLLQGAWIHLMYSDIYFDNRISDLWINQFNLKHFFVGFSWALATINGLIHLCETSFYKKYYKYFNN